MTYGIKKIDLLYEDLTYKIRGVLFEVHRELGRFATEKQDADLFEAKLKYHKMNYRREQRVGDSGNITDFIIEDKIVVEFKAKPFLLKKDYYQLQRYLQSTQLKLGLLVNFRSEYLNPKRVLLAESADIRSSVSNP